MRPVRSPHAPDPPSPKSSQLVSVSSWRACASLYLRSPPSALRPHYPALPPCWALIPRGKNPRAQVVINPQVHGPIEVHLVLDFGLQHDVVGGVNDLNIREIFGQVG